MTLVEINSCLVTNKALLFHNLYSSKSIQIIFVIADITLLKILESYFNFYFNGKKSILYAKIAIFPKKFIPKFSFKYYIGLLFS